MHKGSPEEPVRKICRKNVHFKLVCLNDQWLVSCFNLLYAARLYCSTTSGFRQTDIITGYTGLTSVTDWWSGADIRTVASPALHVISRNISDSSDSCSFTTIDSIATVRVSLSLSSRAVVDQHTRPQVHARLHGLETPPRVR